MRYSTASKQSRAGFTLVEVVTAIFVMSVGVFGAFHLYSQNMSQTYDMFHEQQATMALSNMMETACADLPAMGEHGPDADTRVLLERLREPEARLVVAWDEDLGLYRLTGTVTWHARNGRMRSLEFVTLRAPDPVTTREEADDE